MDLIDQNFDELRGYVEGLRRQISRLTVQLVESHKWNEALSDDLVEWDDRLHKMEQLAHTMYDALVSADSLLDVAGMPTSDRMIDAMEDYMNMVGFNR